MTRRKINWVLIVSLLGVLSAWAIWVLNGNAKKGQAIDKLQVSGNSQVAQAEGNGKVTQVGTMNGDMNFYERPTIIQPDAEKVRTLEKKIEELTSYKGAFPDRPKLIVPPPKVDLIFYTEQAVPDGLAKGRFEVVFLNIGGVDAKNVRTKWTIFDNDRAIMGLNEWLELVKQPPMIIDSIHTGDAKGLTYIPDMGQWGKGKIRFAVDFTYANAKTGEEYADRYSGSVLYENPRDDKAREFIFSKAIE